VSDALATLLKLVSEGRLTAEEAAPIAAALQEEARRRNETRRPAFAQEALADRRLRVLIVEDGRQIVNLQIPLAAAGFAIDQVPGLSPDHRSRIVEAIQSGMTGPILEVADEGNEVRIVIE
jgi:hypothetical protein